MLRLLLLFVVGLAVVWLIPFLVNVVAVGAIAIIDEIGRSHRVGSAK